MLNITAGGISGGYRKYLENILVRLACDPRVSALLVAIPKTVDFSWSHKEFPFIQWLDLNPSRLSITELDLRTRRKIKEFGPDVIFIPTARSWKMESIPVVKMVRNMEPLAWNDGNPFLERIANWLRAREVKRSIRKSDRVIAVSKFVKQVMIQKWNVPADEIIVVCHGVESSDDVVLQRPSLVPESWKEKFLFAAGSIRPARGLEDALNAMTFLDGLPEICGLVIAGNVCPRMRAYKKHLEKWIKLQGLSSKVCWTGQLDDREMAWCYQNCNVFLMTSRVEACPNIALEAMAHGCLSIAANNPPLPEVFQDAAVFYSPKKPEMLAQRIKDALSWSEGKKQRLKQKAKKRAAEFSWDVCAEKTLSELEKAITSSG